MWEQVQETVSYIKEKIDFTPEYGVILGSGLGSFTDEIKVKYTLAYHEIPNFPVSTVQGHKGALIFGTIGTKNVVAMQGRFHFYEGYSMTEVTFPVRVMKYLGVEKLVVSNASGSSKLFLPLEIAAKTPRGSYILGLMFKSFSMCFTKVNCSAESAIEKLWL